MRHLRINHLFLLILIIEIVLISLVVFFQRENTILHEQLTQAQHNQFKMNQAADRLRQSSDDLTRFARTYTVSGNPKYKQNFFRVLDIRNGKAPRPKHYESIYWDYLQPELSPMHKDGEPLALETIMDALPFSSEEREKLRESHQNSDDLVNLEVEAFHAMEGRFKDSEGKYTIEGMPDQQRAIQLLHGQAYHIAKEKIMQPIDDFILISTERTNTIITALTNESHDNNAKLEFIIGLFILTNIAIFFILYKRVIKRLTYITESIRHAKDGKVHIDTSNFTNEDEFKTLADEFNHMQSLISKRTKNLESTKEELEALNAETEVQNDQLLQYSECLAQEVEEEVTTRMKEIRHFQEILNNTSDMISLVDSEYVYRYVNSSYLEMFDISVPDIIGKRVPDFIGEDKFKSSTKTYLDRALSGELINYRSWFDFGSHGKHFMDVTYNPYRPENEKIEGVVANIRNITEQHKIEEAHEAQEQILIQQSKMAAMGEMIGAISHQFKQPINAVALLAQDIEDAYEFNELTDESLGKSIESILKQTRFMSHTVDDFRNFFKPSKETKPFNPEEAIQNALQLMKPQLDKAHISYELHSTGLYQCVGFVNEFKQVILNIINNARDILIEKKIKNPRIDFDLAHDTMFGVIVIKDNGGGIPEDLLPNKIFEPYVTTKGDKGTGIGLQIARTVIEKNMGGTILATNNEEGAEFMISLPLSIMQS